MPVGQMPLGKFHWANATGPNATGPNASGPNATWPMFSLSSIDEMSCWEKVFRSYVFWPKDVRPGANVVKLFTAVSYEFS